MVMCKNEWFELEDKLDLSYRICPDFDNIPKKYYKLEGAYTTTKRYSWSTEFYLCKGRPDCATKEEIKFIIESMYMTEFLHIKKAFIHNKNDPTAPTLKYLNEYVQQL